ncbi:tRNA (adenosine(37)-N6)-threonylcarbamoyltransferase complex dimerization subunit type 1 TsaB [Roseateles amylovorans]|uniref:tRNA (Adenosine(37)-N6)-threonylcarbamoyltransferase complex dimerization subunit type 1 TsaB n=1 Tax=Roseateles amylovorans TaxID=2978473 RepID=A0ABY6B718_9BURK|nr:tRNA (adenosine(37)-N6)-threonylcarbamoyltransferase complex dimerization subunit type 1 TsaB [Roseateles amylovorans]UXH79010.1 tRNA (adenosine(37)-N6)-threonylcarbamoyltransferase complex dimerization subunit type 1 TsaB [Roseateles amylovorans]
MSVLLALDSSTEHMALALVGQGHVAFVDADGGAQASQRLVPDAMALLRQAGLTLAQVDAVAFGRGPGAFTGLRTACSVAQGLAFGASKPVLSLDSLMLVAEDARQQALVAASASASASAAVQTAPATPDSAVDAVSTADADADADAPDAGLDVWVAMDARMNQIYAGRYQWDGRAWHTVVAPMLIDPEPLQALWLDQPAACVAGTALLAFALDTGSARRVEHTVSRARALGALAQQAWAQGRAEDPAHALPLYVRDKIAQTTDEREQAKAAANALQTPPGVPAA